MARGLVGTAAAAWAGGLRQLGALPITYRVFVSSTLNPVTNIQTAVYRDAAVAALKADVTVRDLPPGGAGPVQLGDARFTFRWTDVAWAVAAARAKTLTTSDRIVQADGTTFRVIMVARQSQDAFVVVTARREG